MTETIESTEKASPIRFDPFSNPGPLAEEEAAWLNAEFPGLDITPGQVRAVISNHARFQKSPSRQANRAAEAQALAAEREARQARHQERIRLAAENKAQKEAQKAEREAKKAADEAAKAVAAASAATDSEDGEAPKKVRKPRPSKAQVAPDAQETF